MLNIYPKLNTLSMMTTLTPNYETCGETYANFWIFYPKKYPANYIEDVTKIESHQFDNNLAFDDISLSQGDYNAWLFSSKGKVASKDLRHHLDWLINRLMPVKENIKCLQSEEDIKMTVLCIWGSVCGHSGPALWPKQMQALAELNLRCDFDFYSCPDED